MSNTTIKEVKVNKKVPKTLQANRSVAEVLEYAASFNTNEDKIKVLKAYETKGLKFVINMMYNWDWSGTKIPKHTKSGHPSDISYKTINSCITDLSSAYKFKDTKPEVTRKILIKTLESLSTKESELIIDVIKGKKIEGISKSVFKRAFPNFFLDTSSDPSE